MTIDTANTAERDIPVMGLGDVPETLTKAATGIEGLGRARAERAEAAARTAEARPEGAVRRRRTSLGAPQLKLGVATTNLEGYHLFWANDQDNYIESLLEEGFEYCTPEEVRMGRASHNTVTADSDVVNRVSKHVDTTTEGQAMRAYLLKCPLDLWEDIQSNVSDLADSRDQDIRESAERGGDRYQPKGYQTKVTSGSRR